MNEESLKVLKIISHKLDQLIFLGKLTNRDTLEKFKREIRKDPIFSKILDLADGSLNYSEITDEVAEEMQAAKITVMKKISTLKEKGFLTTRREGKEVFYEISGLYD